MFIATPNNRNVSPWTTPTPTSTVFQRIQLLAKQSLEVLSEQLVSAELSQADFKVCTFVSPAKFVVAMVIHGDSPYV